MHGHEVAQNILRSSVCVEWVTRLVRSRLGAAGPVELCLPEVPHTYPVIVVHCGGQPRFVLKLFHEFRRFLKVVSKLRFMDRLDLPVARLRHWSFGSRFTCLRRYLLVHEFVPGRVLDVSSKDNESDLSRIASTLAALHSVSRRGLFGVTPSLKRGSYLGRGPYLRFYGRQTRAYLEAMNGHLEPGLAETIAERFHHHAQPLLKRSRFELLHSDVKPSHYILTDRSAIIVDLDQAHFGDFALDLVSALHVFCDDCPERKRLFLHRYFAEVHGPTEADFLAHEPFYHGDFHLRAAAYWADRLEAEGPAGELVQSRFHKELEECYQALGAKA